MRKIVLLGYSLLVALCIVACAQQGGGVVVGPKTPEAAMSRRPNEHGARRILRTYLVGLAKGQRRPAFFKIIEGRVAPRAVVEIMRRTQVVSDTRIPQDHSRHPSAIPVALPTAWCPPSVSGDTGNWACGLLNPPGGEADLDMWCVNCSQSDNPVSVTLTYQNSYTPPPNFLVQQSSCVNGSCGSPTNCSSSSGCTVQACYQPYPACYTYTQFIAQEGAPPANIVAQNVMTGAQGNEIPSPWTMYLTVTPDLVDLDIGGSDKVVSFPHASPAAIMDGQQVSLQASPAADLSSVQWYFDSSATSDVVAKAYTRNAQVVGSPSPVTQSGNPNTFYWLTGGTKEVVIIAQAPNVQGPLINGFSIR